MINVNHKLIREDLRIIGSDAFTVLMVITSFVGVKKTAFPHITTIRNMSGLSKGRAYKAISILTDNGFIERNQQHGNKGEWGKVLYRLTTKYLSIYVGVDQLEFEGEEGVDRVPQSRHAVNACSVNACSVNAAHLSIDNTKYCLNTSIENKEEEETFVSTPPEVEKVEQPKQPEKETKAEAETTDHFAKVEGLKKKIGPKHYGLLNEVYDVPGMKAKLGQLWVEKKFNILTDFLEHRKEIGKLYPTKKGIVDLINIEFQDYTIEELAAGLHKAIKGTHQGFYPDHINKPKATEKEPENYELLNQINVARGGFNIPAQKVA